MAIQSVRARRDQIFKSPEETAWTLTVGDKVLVAKRNALRLLKMPPIESRSFGPCDLIAA